MSIKLNLTDKEKLAEILPKIFESSKITFKKIADDLLDDCKVKPKIDAALQSIRSMIPGNANNLILDILVRIYNLQSTGMKIEDIIFALDTMRLTIIDQSIKEAKLKMNTIDHSNITDALKQEINRCTDILEEYKHIGPAGKFGASMIELELKEANKTLDSQDIKKILSSYKELKDVE